MWGVIAGAVQRNDILVNRPSAVRVPATHQVGARMPGAATNSYAIHLIHLYPVLRPLYCPGLDPVF